MGVLCVVDLGLSIALIHSWVGIQFVWMGHKNVLDTWAHRSNLTRMPLFQIHLILDLLRRHLTNIILMYICKPV